MATPVERVFGIAELLEAILLPVDMKTLLLSQRVNATFRDTISTSPRLQEKLYLRQIQAPPSSGYRDLEGIKNLANTLLVRHNPRIWDWIDLSICMDAVTGARISCCAYNTRPPGIHLRLQLEVKDSRSKRDLPQCEGETHQCNGDPSWQRMYLFSYVLPADITHTTVETWLYDGGPNRGWQSQDPQDWHAAVRAMTLGEIYERAKEILLCAERTEDLSGERDLMISIRF
ncbi:hypothetical protein LTR56_000502 [Elasticomyces elasticus]|nr:hypothetical protein LTR22_014230 [Elasticomyces elasticus]KAK3660744.1 hypothetical protein LTR56_000502 [Elasticomyces elasticus]KAK4922890.1 hypothetical protein LTR49_009897 [Elasticomyces elasticus]KAK5759734.1 hypothetical protein LTS12_010074 [Elasticomyces elasticus]